MLETAPEIETSLSTVMPGVKWPTWKPLFLPDTDSLTEKVRAAIETFLSTFTGHKISSQKLKQTMSHENVSPMTWQRAVKAFCEQDHASKESHVRGGFVSWRLQGQSLVKQTTELLGFSVAMANK